MNLRVILLNKNKLIQTDFPLRYTINKNPLITEQDTAETQGQGLNSLACDNEF